MGMKKIRSYMEIYPEQTGAVIYGATLGGKIVCQALQHLGAEVLCFCDRGKKGQSYCGLPVIGPEELGQTPDAAVVIALTRSYRSALQTLRALGISNTICEAAQLLSGKSADDFRLEEEERIEAENFLKKYGSYACFGGEEILLPTLEVFITEKCTLRCKDCTHLIPLYQAPAHHSIAEIRTALKRLFTAVARVQDFVILGGEPLLHPELPVFLKWCARQEQIENITILTNGTLLPQKDCVDALVETGTRIRVSDYGALSSKKHELESLCGSLSIPFYLNHDEWVALGYGEPHAYTSAEQKKIFADCPFSVEHVLLDGKLCRCAHGAHLYRLGLIDGQGADCVDLMEKTLSEPELERQLRNYLDMDGIGACRFCNGCDPQYSVVPALQAERVRK